MPDDPLRANDDLSAGEATAAAPIEGGSRRLQTVLARCRAGVENYAVRREQWWRDRLVAANAAARQARSLAFGRKRSDGGDNR